MVNAAAEFRPKSPLKTVVASKDMRSTDRRRKDNKKTSQSSQQSSGEGTILETKETNLDDPNDKLQVKGSLILEQSFGSPLAQPHHNVIEVFEQILLLRSSMPRARTDQTNTSTATNEFREHVLNDVVPKFISELLSVFGCFMHTMSGSKEESMHNEDTTEFRVHASMKTTYHISDGEPPGQKKYLQALNRESPAILQLAQASSLDQTTRAT
ncbi:hypothetical protein AXG93_3016s1420 [Marchantia polymorpha subsp. ruderalis]|uniref:Uncharacterized protein n=1 Tax=Marchantia polymorpha subsp. ruderalis TaxID=1480154 RepID=A0A176WBS6_MARPO|nr:hypothetical protein AXG93_3016s1420 [Marchantia polymorpha subsp. ruderalis]